MNFDSFQKYKTLLEYVNDEDALRIHTNKFGYRVDDNGELFKIPLDDETRGDWHSFTKNDLSSMINFMNNQLIVYMATIIEASISDFFKCLFQKEPNRLLLLRDNPNLGFSLQDFLKHESKQSYISELSNRAANFYSSGHIRNVTKKIREVSGLVLEEEVLKILTEVSLLRNEIVHEGKNHEIDLEKLDNFSNVIEEFLRAIGKKLSELGIEIIDPADFLGLFYF
ncbi:HEPN domain-containing protein [Paenibacillus sp. NPDC055715]